jgi:hypothetical protein
MAASRRRRCSTAAVPRLQYLAVLVQAIKDRTIFVHVVFTQLSSKLGLQARTSQRREGIKKGRGNEGKRGTQREARVRRAGSQRRGRNAEAGLKVDTAVSTFSPSLCLAHATAR